MAGTLRPKGSYEERNRAAYVENKQAKIEEALRIVQMRNTVLRLSRFVFELTLFFPFSGGRYGRLGRKHLDDPSMALNDNSDHDRQRHPRENRVKRMHSSHCTL